MVKILLVDIVVHLMQDIPREPIIRLRFPTSYSSSSGNIRYFARQEKYARYYKIEKLVLITNPLEHPIILK